jgi:large subunit ribosomal protein L9
MANQKLLLIQDVEALGRSGDVVTVKPGYARNFLLPQKKAIVANNQTLRSQARLQEERQKQAIIDKKEAEVIALKINEATIETTVKVDQEGHMYGSVSTLDIVHLLQEQHHTPVEKSHILLKHPIKEIGVHTINLKLKEGVPATITLKVLAEGSEE